MVVDLDIRGSTTLFNVQYLHSLHDLHSGIYEAAHEHSMHRA